MIVAPTRRLVGLDTETHLVRRGALFPPLVCVTVHEQPGDGPPPEIYLADEGLDRALALLRDDEVTLAIHHAPFDLGVLVAHAERDGRGPEALDAVFRALWSGRIVDTRIRERLIRIALGELEFSLVPGADGGPPRLTSTPYDLAGLVWRYFRVALGGKSGEDAWRLRYAELDGVPLDLWPRAAVDYALADATWAAHVAEAQLADYPRVIGPYASLGADGRPHAERRETEAAWCLYLWAGWGVRTDPAAVREALAAWESSAEAGRAVGRAHGWVRPNGSVDKKAVQAAVVSALGERAPKTAPSKTFPDGQVKTDAETLTACGGDLAVYATSLQWTLVRQRWAHVLPLGVVRPITSRPESLIETGRTSWSNPPWQQPPRSGGVRETVVPRPGWLLCSVDYHVAELVALAQVCRWAGLGSRLGDALNAGIDPHLQVAAELLAIPYAEAARRKAEGDGEVKDARTLAKALNFGLPGGLQAEGFRGFAKGYGIELSPERAEELVEWWHRVHPEIRAYFAWVEATLGHDGVVQHPVSGRLRGGTRLTAACNGYFQGLIADAAKYGSSILTACAYGCPHPDLVGGRLPGISALRGREIAELLAGRCRPVLFLHDEVLAEVLEPRASELGDAIAEILIAAGRRHTPDIALHAEPALQRRWSKGAESRRGPDGRWSVYDDNTVAVRR